jgi:hypothetical protein
MTYMQSWKSHRLTSHTWLGLNPQIGRPLSRIVVPLVYFFISFTSLKWFYMLKSVEKWLCKMAVQSIKQWLVAPS